MNEGAWLYPHKTLFSEIGSRPNLALGLKCTSPCSEGRARSRDHVHWAPEEGAEDRCYLLQGGAQLDIVVL